MAWISLSLRLATSLLRSGWCEAVDADLVRDRSEVLATRGSRRVDNEFSGFSRSRSLSLSLSLGRRTEDGPWATAAAISVRAFEDFARETSFFEDRSGCSP